MGTIDNIFNVDNLSPNINLAAYFILLYEHFEDMVISVVKEMYSEPCMLDGSDYSDIDDKYIKALERKIANGEIGSPVPYRLLLSHAKAAKKEYENEVLAPIKKKDGRTFRGSLLWLQNNGVLSLQEKKRVMKIRNRRNDIVHELLKTLGEGFSDKDLKMIADLLIYYRKINDWYFEEIEMSFSEIQLPEDASSVNVLSNDYLTLIGLFRILLCNEGELFKRLLENESKS